MKILATQKKEQNRAALDPWTLVHLGAGLALGLMEVPFLRSLAAAAVYELVEQAVEHRDWGQELFGASRPESLENALLDIVVFAVGHRLGMAWNRSA